jgi:hypothetical protein
MLIRWLPYLFGIILMSPSLVWILKDNTVWPWDQAWYGEVSIDLWYTLINHPEKWILALLNAFGSKAPGIAWFGQFFVPVGRMAGSIEFGLLMSVILVQFGTLILIYKIGAEFDSGNRMPPIIGCLLVASAPLFIAMSHQYFTEPMQLFAVTYIFWIALVSASLNRFQIVGYLLLATGLALIAKASSPIYCFIPGCMALYEAFKRERSSKDDGTTGSNWLIFLAGLILLVGTAGWYLKNLDTVRDFIRQAASGEVALHYGTRDLFLNKLTFWLNAFRKSIGMTEVFSIVVLVGIAAVALSVMRRSNEEGRLRLGRPDQLALAGLLHIVGVLALFSININQDNRYLLPLLPSFTVVVLWCMVRLKIRPILAGILAVLLGQWVIVSARAHGFAPLDPNISYLVKVANNDSRTKSEIDNLVNWTCPVETSGRYNIIGVDLPWLNANTLSFYAAKARLHNHYECYYTSLGYAENNPEKAWTRLEALQIAYFISLDEGAHPESPNFLNQVSLPILKRVLNDERFERIDFDSKLNIVVFRNVDNVVDPSSQRETQIFRKG